MTTYEILDMYITPGLTNSPMFGEADGLPTFEDAAQFADYVQMVWPHLNFAYDELVRYWRERMLTILENILASNYAPSSGGVAGTRAGEYALRRVGEEIVELCQYDNIGRPVPVMEASTLYNMFQTLQSFARYNGRYNAMSQS
jgi:hypothetical protein